MKKFILTIATITSFVSANAQIPFAYLDINNIKADVFPFGYLGIFETPKGSARYTVGASSLWIGGFDASSTLKIAGQTYRQSGVDFWPGPLDLSASTNATTIAAYNKVWKLNQCDIDDYTMWLNSGMIGPNPIDSIAMNTIINWPAVSSFGLPLAPFFDSNTNGTYDPYAGDYPLIKGDQAIFFVFNDKGGVHGETGGAAIGLEIQAMIYEYSCPDDSSLYNTVFANYKIFNRSSFTLDSTYIGNWADIDLGSASDDFVGCDVERGAYYCYNGDMIDDNPPSGQMPYGVNPPSQGIVFLSGPLKDANGLDDVSTLTPNGTNYGDLIVDNERLGMSKFVYYNNDGTVTGNPSTAVDFYNYLVGTWKDATPWTYGGTGHSTGVACDYMFPGVSDPLGFGTNMIPQSAWDETIAGNIPADRRGLGAYGPFTFQPGAVQEIDFAYVYGRATSGGNLASVVVMQERIDSIRQKFNNGITGCGCSSLTGINNYEINNSLSIYPNPASENITINFISSSKNTSVKIYDARGRMVKNMENVKSGETTLNVSELESGLYLINVNNGKSSVTKRFVKQ